MVHIQRERYRDARRGLVEVVCACLCDRTRGGIDERVARCHRQRVPVRRVGDPREVARTSLFLASDESSYLCGAEIAVDGGMLCGQYYVGFPGAPGV